jgi:hypothetical protein
MALRKPFVLSTEGFHEELPTSETLDVGSIEINASGTGIDMNGKKISDLGNGTLANDVLNKAQIEALVASGGVFKEPVHSQDQLINGASGGIAALEVLYFANQPAVGDTVIFYDGTNTRTYTFVANIAGESAATDVSIETSAATAMARLVTRMNADVGNTWWHGYIHTTGEFNTTEIHIIEEATPADALSTSRIYGVWTTQADAQVAPFSDGSTAIQYNVGVNSTLPAADPTSGRFGFSRVVGSLVDGEIHLALDINAQFAWEDSADLWNQISGAGAIPDATSGSGGGVKGLATFDSDKGLQVIANAVAEVKLATDKGIQFSSGGLAIKIADTDELSLDANGLNVQGVDSNFKINGMATGNTVTAPNLDDLTDGSSADLLHTHTGSSVSLAHSDLSGIGENDHHNRSHDLESASDHVTSGGIAGHVLTQTGATTFAFQAPGAAPEAPKVEDTRTTSTDTTVNGDPVYFNGNDVVGKARADTDTKSRVIGVIRAGGGAAPTSVEIVTEGPCAGILGGGGVANIPYYLQATGGLGTSLPTGSTRVICVGYAINANDLFVLIKDYGKKAA